MNLSTEQTWEEWLEHNLNQGCSPQDLFDILIENGFRNASAQSMLETAHQITTATVFIEDQSGADHDSVPGSNAIIQHNDNPRAHSKNDIYLPTALKVANDTVEMYGVDGFLTTEECQHLIMLIRENRQRSTTTDEGVSLFRTSSTCELASLGDRIVEEIDRRICQFMGIDSMESEPIQGQWYEAGQEFKSHTDYFDPASPTFDKHIGPHGQRTWTFMIYLNSTRRGGSTYFPELDLNIEPQAGTALIWNNRDASGALNPSTVHHGTKVQAGYKAIITKWFEALSRCRGI